MIRKSIFAALLIALGVYVLMAAPAPIGTFLFAFGLMSICFYEGHLYTGKCGYVKTKEDIVRLMGVLGINVIAGWFFGFVISRIDPRATEFALSRINNWTDITTHIVQAAFCGVVMFIAVDMKKRHNNVLGIVYGIPLFIFCGFQHSIANAIICGMAETFHWYVIMAAMANWVGALIARTLAE